MAEAVVDVFMEYLIRHFEIDITQPGEPDALAPLSPSGSPDVVSPM
jgi:hypothetical protein